MNEEKDLSRSDQPQPGSSTADPRGDDRASPREAIWQHRAEQAEYELAATRREVGRLDAANTDKQQRIDWLEGTALPHARLQSNADGFQTGWHAALKRVQEGDPVEELKSLLPGAALSVVSAVPQEKKEEEIVRATTSPSYRAGEADLRDDQGGGS